MSLGPSSCLASVFLLPAGAAAPGNNEAGGFRGGAARLVWKGPRHGSVVAPPWSRCRGRTLGTQERCPLLLPPWSLGEGRAKRHPALGFSAAYLQPRLHNQLWSGSLDGFSSSAVNETRPPNWPASLRKRLFD